ncbi:unnamed protein product [Schistosoma margrebowiei]|uniref:Uncharacterized protein n=1 Tax=Schistosoma margrebowiei TaxID=48269 RepID=A0A183LFW0_9TREM|nr:unnamed protein product [Schistosoma margrebowiei]
MKDLRAKKRAAYLQITIYLEVAKMRLKLKNYWTTGETALQRFNTAFLRRTDKLNNRLQVLQHLLKQHQTTMDNNWKRIKDALTPEFKQVLGRNKHHHKEQIFIDTLDRIQERKNKEITISNNREIQGID